MRYVQATGRLAASVVDAEPEPLLDGHVRVAVAYVGVCHSDLAEMAQGGGAFPRRLGHEVSGVVIETTTDTRTVGTRVVTYVDDGYASEIVTPVERTVPLHPNCSLLDGALAEPVACVIGGLEMLSFREHSQVVLVGAGFMGLLALRYLTAIGHRVFAIEPRTTAQEFARCWGADTVVHPDEVPGVMHQSQSIVIEATGTAAGLRLAGDLVGIDGTLGILGYHQAAGGKRTVDMEGWNYRAMRVVSLHNRRVEKILTWIDRAQRSAALGFISPGHLVDAQVNLDELTGILAGQPRDDAIKTVLRLDTEGD
ncbi:MAG: alcohol dehydrogenase catalytic domain-containing protein [Actinobacteria bacterium]|nr:alcohol dehydrogenase catalytic domain-containing protein [Actinomycetota bacterium]